MGLKGRLSRLEALLEGEVIEIPQRDGTPKRFPQSAPQESFVTNMRRLRGEDVPPQPLGVTAAESPAPEWSGSLYAASWPDVVRPPKDLSE